MNKKKKEALRKSDQMLYRLNYLIQRCFEEIRSDAVSTDLPYQNYTKRVFRRKFHCLRTSLSHIMTNLHQTNLHQNYTKQVSRRKLHCLRTSLSLIMTKKVTQSTLRNPDPIKQKKKKQITKLYKIRDGKLDQVLKKERVLTSKKIG